MFRISTYFLPCVVAMAVWLLPLMGLLYAEDRNSDLPETSKDWINTLHSAPPPHHLRIWMTSYLSEEDSFWLQTSDNRFFLVEWDPTSSEELKDYPYILLEKTRTDLETECTEVSDKGHWPFFKNIELDTLTEEIVNKSLESEKVLFEPHETFPVLKNESRRNQLGQRFLLVAMGGAGCLVAIYRIFYH